MWGLFHGSFYVVWFNREYIRRWAVDCARRGSPLQIPARNVIPDEIECPAMDQPLSVKATICICPFSDIELGSTSLVKPSTIGTMRVSHSSSGPTSLNDRELYPVDQLPWVNCLV